MILRANGIKAWIFLLIVLVGVILLLLLIFNIFLFLLPLIIIIVIVSYLLRMLNKVKKDKPKDYIDIDFKIKKWNRSY